MSGFNTLLGSSHVELTPAEGVVGIAFCAVAADRRITTEELSELASSLSGMDMFSGFGKAKLLKGAKKVYEIAEERGTETLLDRSTEAIPQDMCDDVFRTAAGLIEADEQVTDAERRFLDDLERELDLPTGQARHAREGDAGVRSS